MFPLIQSLCCSGTYTVPSQQFLTAAPCNNFLYIAYYITQEKYKSDHLQVLLHPQETVNISLVSFEQQKQQNSMKYIFTFGDALNKNTLIF